MKRITWSGYEWITRQGWGDVHPDKPENWYDPSAVEINPDGYLVLKTHFNPKQFDFGISPIGVGLVSCTTHFGYGTFEIEAKLPTGYKLWPAFWMYATDSWPPEIDVFEGYSNKRGSYWRWGWPVWNVQSNVHYGIYPDNKNIGAKVHKVRNPSRKYNKYCVYYGPDRIEIRYNGVTVRKIAPIPFFPRDMQIILNNATTYAHKKNKEETTEFTIKYFKYIPLELIREV